MPLDLDRGLSVWLEVVMQEKKRPGLKKRAADRKRQEQETQKQERRKRAGDREALHRQNQITD